MALKWVLIFSVFKFIYIMSYFGKWWKKTVIYKIGEAKFILRVNTSDKLMLFEVWKSRDYIDPEFDIQKGDVVVDIGANIGLFSVLASKKASNGAIFAYEPNEENYSILLKNKFLNKVNNLFPFNLAITSRKGDIDFCMSKLNAAGHSIYETDSKRKIRVKSNTLKDILTTNKIERINYLKIDAEGAEYDILLNAPQDVLRKIDKIVLEYHDFLVDDYNYFDLKKCLENNGFKVTVCDNMFGFFGRIFGSGMIKAKRSTS